MELWQFANHSTRHLCLGKQESFFFSSLIFIWRKSRALFFFKENLAVTFLGLLHCLRSVYKNSEFLLLLFLGLKVLLYSTVISLS